MTKEIIEGLKAKLGYGDQGKIARSAGVSKVTVNRFYNGKDGEIVDTIKEKILSATIEILDNRAKVQKAILKKTNQILN